MTTSNDVSLVIGTYAQLITPPEFVDGVRLFEWTCGVFPHGRPFADMSSIVERVEFTLHKSFENV